MFVFFIMGFVILILVILNMDGKMKKQLENEQKIIERLDQLIEIQKESQNHGETSDRE
ncbi:hypothetical protein [Paenibacillus glycanilyticus]|uniref:DUF4083 domain-containing protein n=1 Tax=Paenibacillus glycanilyticus TaxID=126569 RepID=A0ABQ6GEX8_9BACL|nr:hypothetical protein [Paenibacillus glycanilyticus]GLX67871.1 hypothetical protein MU1_22160 [Paenibacillus glycanilyticus]